MDKQELFDKWLLTQDRTEFINLAIQLFPNMGRKKAEEIANTVGLKPEGASQDAIDALLDLSITTEEAVVKSAEITIREAEERPTWEDFFDAEGRPEKEAILQKMFDGSLSPEEIEAFFPKDDD